jgi:hypothetical protein
MWLQQKSNEKIYETQKIPVSHPIQGCQMVYFQTKKPNLSKFWRALKREIMVYFMAIWNI